MSVEISSLTNRQWAQVRAALQFWRAMAEVSRSHPSRHPGVEQEFKEHGPLSLEELDELLEDGLPQRAWVTMQLVANKYGLTKAAVDSIVEKLGIEPDMYVGRTQVFRVETVGPVVKEIERRGHAPIQ